MSFAATPYSRRSFGLLAGGAGLILSAPAFAQQPAGVPPAPVEGGAGWVDLLKQEHRQVERLFEQILATSAEQTEQRTQLLTQLKDALTMHGLREENALYPMMREQQHQAATADELFKEHADIKTHLFALETMPKAEDAWLDRVRTFQTAIAEHVQEEEEEVFPALQNRLTAEQTQMLAQAVQREGDKCRA